ncbi:MAG: prephenate dehydratase, partial [Spirochaetaceae bacterium]|nr:prephenate dehydratase [Spirochaetaceae bacterium]
VASDQVDLFRDYVDLFQIGARNMQNFELLKAVGATGLPVMLKRGQSARIEEWLMAAEYLLAHGTENVVLCERGIRTFETYTRNTLDISSIPVVKKLSHLPIFVDPSHATGIRDKVLPMALAAVAAGADGLMIEVHPRPEEALSDGPQSLFPVQFEKLMRDIEALSPVVGKEVSRIPRVRTKVAGGPGRTSKPRRAGKPGEADDGGMLIAFQGARGAYSEMALRRYFDNESFAPFACRHFRDVFEAVLEGKATYGVIPIENSLAGSVHENYDLLVRYPDLKIIGETKLRVEHSLIGVPGATLEGIRAVYSHPQALAQCDDYLREHAAWELTPFYDTAGSVAHIADEGNLAYAAIANAQAAEVYGMAVLKEGIETNPRNYTRFVVLAGSDEAEVTDANKASLVFSTPDQPGALFAAMKVMADASLNLKKLESRPIAGRPWQYMFYVDVEIPPSRESYAAALTTLEAAVEDLRVLGTYRAN